MSNLLRIPQNLQDDPCVQSISADGAGWKYVGFSAFLLNEDKNSRHETHGQEVCLVLLSGRASISCNSFSKTAIGDRDSVFSQTPPYAVYFPPGETFEIRALTNIEYTLSSAPAQGKYPARIIKPDECEYKPRGEGTNLRLICNILFDDQAAEHLLVVEVITPSGHWSSYPPHKHDSDVPGSESLLEETYYHRLNPPQGYVLQRVYTDDRSIDESLVAVDRSVVLVPRGYHPVGVPHGYESYYLNTMAGPKREWIFRNDPDHEWILSK